jgi:hypothetical protein
MGRKIAVAVFPFQGGFRTSRAKPSVGKLSFSAAPAAILYDLMAKPAIVRTSIFGHKRALHAASNSCANHFTHSIESRFVEVKKKALNTGQVEIALYKNV